MSTERQKMLAGELYDAADAELLAARRHAHALCRALDGAAPADRAALLAELFGTADVDLTPPFFCDYGRHIVFGDKVYLNAGCVILDVAPVTLGSHVLLGPGVHVYTATHPIDAATRRAGLELGRPVVIGDDVWIGGGAIVLPGVTIGAGTVVGAGSVVTRDLPAGVVAAGNPCRVLRRI